MATQMSASRIPTRCLSRYPLRRHTSFRGGVRLASSQAQNSGQPLLPSVAHLLHEHSISDSDIPKIPATGPSGRLLKGDVLSYVGAISSDYPSNLSNQISQSSHLDLSNIKPAPAAPAPKAENQQQEQKQQQEATATTPPTVEHIKVSVPVSYTNLWAMQERLDKGIGVSPDVATLVERASRLANIDLPVSRDAYASGPGRIEYLYDQLLNTSASSSPSATTSHGTYFPVPESELDDLELQSPTNKATTTSEEDIIDILSGRASSLSPARHPKKFEPLSPEEEPSETFTLTVPKTEKARALEFLRRVQSYVTDRPEDLLRI